MAHKDEATPSGALADEKEAIHQYGKMKSRASDPKLKHIAGSNLRDERKHAGRLTRYLRTR